MCISHTCPCWTDIVRKWVSKYHVNSSLLLIFQTLLAQFVYFSLVLAMWIYGETTKTLAHFSREKLNFTWWDCHWNCHWHCHWHCHWDCHWDCQCSCLLWRPCWYRQVVCLTGSKHLRRGRRRRTVQFYQFKWRGETFTYCLGRAWYSWEVKHSLTVWDVHGTVLGGWDLSSCECCSFVSTNSACWWNGTN